MSSGWKQGEQYVWASAAAVTVTFAILVTLVVVVMINGLGFFWPKRVAVARLTDGSLVMGELSDRERIPDSEEWRVQFRTGNRDLYGLDFRWIEERNIAELTYPEEAVTLERQEFGNFYGFLKAVQRGDAPQPSAGTPWAVLGELREFVEEEAETLEAMGGELADISRKMEGIRRANLKLAYRGEDSNRAAIAANDGRLKDLRAGFEARNEDFSARVTALNRTAATFTDVSGKEKETPLVMIVRAYRPNTLSRWGKMVVYASKVKELLLGDPRESNTEGGLFPAIFGTVILVMVMSVFCIPLGVVAAIYLREYAREGWLVQLARIAVYNLAGVPSIVYGVFGLGFFVYGVGGTIDQLFFPERLPAPTFGTGGILWASLTLSLLTVPVVIVTTEEALSSIPVGVREGSLSLGATQFQTLVRILLPMASPGIMTGFILAMARAAGEVAPLMITGVVKLAPALPVDGQFPFVHLDRKFMHLGFHIFDVGFQSPNAEAAKPMVYITTLLLILIVLLLSLGAIFFRNRMRKRYQSAAF